jgi:hypothetical protein
MSAELAATPSNFEAHLANVGNTPADTGSDDGGAQEMRDNTGPSNTNAWGGDVSGAEPKWENPERRAEGDAEDPTQQFSDEPSEGEPQEGEQDEQQAPDGMPPYEQLQEMFQVTQRPELHEYFLDKTVPVPVNGVEVPKTVRELKEGYLRMSDYSRKSQEAAAERGRAQQAIEQNRMFLERMSNPKVLRATLRRLGPQHEAAFEACAEDLARERLSLLKMTPTERAHFQRAQDAERRAEMLEEQARRQPREPEVDPREQAKPQMIAALNAHVGPAWQRYNITPSPLATRVFQMHIQNVWDSQMGSIPEAVERASQATAETLEDLARKHLGQAPQQPTNAPRQVQPLGPRRVPAGAPPRPKLAPGQRDTRFRSTNFADFLKGR